MLGRNGKLLAKQNKAEAVRFARIISKRIAALKLSETASLREISTALNDAGILTASGKQWHPSSIARLLRRLD